MQFEPIVPDEEIEALLGRVRATRWPSAAPAPDQGVPLERLRHLADRWVGDYDWDRYRTRLTALPQIRVTSEGLDVHAIHLRSPRPDAVPLLLGHGWPSTCYEFDQVAPLLADPGADAPAFHVVAPSLPGYAFSQVPHLPGWGGARTADSWAALMVTLGYDRFLVHGGDWGAFVATELALRHPQRLQGLHLTMPLARYAAEDLQSASDAERRGAEREREYRRTGFGYVAIQRSRPQTVGYALEDSPVGLLAWLGEKLEDWCGRDAAGDPLLDDDAILDVVSTYWLTRTATSAARMYYESLRADTGARVAGVPTGCSIFADEIIRPPRVAVERRYGPLASWREIDVGGHFPAAEVPDLFARELRDFAATTGIASAAGVSLR